MDASAFCAAVGRRAEAGFARLLAAGCASPPLELECLAEAEFEARLAVLVCHRWAVCGWMWEESEAACVSDFIESGLRESKGWIGEVCPDAGYDPCEAASWLDQFEHSPTACTGGAGPWGHMDWYHGACGRVFDAA
jgi:hypothetical protein